MLLAIERLLTRESARVARLGGLSAGRADNPSILARPEVARQSHVRIVTRRLRAGAAATDGILSG